MSVVMEKIHRFIYDDICEEVENVMVTVCFTYLSAYTRIKKNDLSFGFLSTVTSIQCTFFYGVNKIFCA